MSLTKKSIFAVSAAGLMLLASSCTAPKDITYFKDVEQAAVITTSPEQQIRVRPGDKLSILVSSKDPSLASLFNPMVVTNSIQNNQNYNGSSSVSRNYSSSGTGMSAYTVAPDGTIQFPVLGKMEVAGFTRNELASFIQGQLIGRDLVKDPTVTVEFLNTGVNVLGEVNAPGRYDINKDRLTVLDAIALAGDLTINGQRKNVKVLRNINGKTQIYFVNLQDTKELMNSPAYYLQQDDIVYVEPNDYKKRTTTVNGNNTLSASFWISVVSVCSSLAVLVVNLVQK